MDIANKLDKISLLHNGYGPYVSIPVFDANNTVIAYKRISLEEYIESYKTKK